jgi:hypothetical protein
VPCGGVGVVLMLLSSLLLLEQPAMDNTAPSATARKVSLCIDSGSTIK